MKALPAIARYMRLPEEQLRYPIELIQQGYEPNYLATYRPDELGGIEVETLARLKRAVEYETRLAEHKEKVGQTLQRDGVFTDSAGQVIEECTSISQVDAIVRSLRSKKSARVHAEANPHAEVVGKAILMAQEPPTDLLSWVASVASLPIEQAEDALQQAKRWLQLLLSEDPKLMLQLQRAILRNATVSLAILPEPAKGEEGDVDASSDEALVPSTGNPSKETPASATVAIDAVADPTSSAIGSTEPSVDEATQTDTVEGNADAVADVVAETTAAPAIDATTLPAVAEASPVAPLIEQFHSGRKQAKSLRTKSLSDKQLSPRQRRRRWLRSILESYSKLKKPLRALTPYQVLMIARGLRSKIVDLQFQQDLRPLIQACRDSFFPGRHPMHALLMEISDSGLKELILPKLHQDVVAILEEDSNQELIEASVLHLQNALLQRPVHGHRVLMIDAVGTKTAAIAIVDPSGEVIATSEIPCNSSKADVVSQNMSLLGQLVHEHRITLIGLSNGPARRYVLPAVVELLRQSTQGSLVWTLVDRSGCDAYTLSRTSLVELPRISRRHRAAAWLAWRLQDPLRQILKVDPARLRLGSYQRELPQAELEIALQESVSATITKAGIDVLSSDVDVLKRIPGMTDEAAERVCRERQTGSIVNRDTLMKCLRETLSETQARQAIGFLRVFGSDNPLDGTIIHPDDYRLAERLIEHAGFSAPPATPEGWLKPDYEKLAAAQAAVANLSVEATLSEAAAPVVLEPKIEINPDFGRMIDEGAPAESEVAGEASEVTAEAAVEESASEETVEASVTDVESSEPNESAEGEDTDTSEAASQTPEAAASETETSEAVLPSAMPNIPTEPMPRPALSVDAEKLARSWQVGRAKLKSVAACLQFPFADTREFRFPVPLRSQVPRLDNLPAGTMLTALVVGVADFGVFVELGPDCSGLIHISRLASDFVEDPHMFVQIGDVIPVWVVNVDEKRKRVSLTAIPPGTPDRKREQTYSQENDPNAASRNRQGAAGGDGRGRRDAARPAAGAGAGNRGTQRGARPEGGGRPDGARSGGGRPAGGRSDGGRGGYGNRGRGGRDRQEQGDQDQQSRKPVRIDKPQPQKPITEAMQQGKEPLRSFSDLMQFMKQSKTPAVTEPETSVAPPETPAPIQERAIDASAAESNASGGDDPKLTTDINTTA